MSYSYQYPHPAVTVDTVVFSVLDEALQVLLIQRRSEPFKDWWALPGGYVRIDEDLEQAARRELLEETAVRTEQLQGMPFFQFSAYGQPDRDPRERTITVSFLTVVPMNRVALKAATDAKDTKWFAVSNLPTLAFDHDKILEDARKSLGKLTSEGPETGGAAAFSFLPDEFTLSQAQSVFEVLKGEKLDKRNFRKWVTSNWDLVNLNKKSSGGRHRPAELYSLKDT